MSALAALALEVAARSAGPDGGHLRPVTAVEL
eukprot:SAG31_NODE_2511_length_5585_cov_2.160408_5_plen_32_part_00